MLEHAAGDVAVDVEGLGDGGGVCGLVLFQ